MLARLRLLEFQAPLFALASVVLLGLFSCATPLANLPRPNDFQTENLWQAYWQEDHAAYAKILNDSRWEVAGSIEAERYRQSQQIKAGKRAAIYAEAAKRATENPNDPDVQYLFARLQQDPIRLEDQFAKLVERWPAHGWIRLGAAGSLQNMGKFVQAGFHLDHTPDWADAREFRNLIQAKQAFAESKNKPWRYLIHDALVAGNPSALLELQFQTRRLEQSAMLQVAQSEYAMRKLHGADEVERLDGLLDRALAEVAAERAGSLDALLERMDLWASDLGLDAEWQDAARYSLPFGFGHLLRPEQQATALGELVLRNHRAFILGSALGQRPILLVLTDVERFTIPWPTSQEPIEVLLAGGAKSSDGGVFAGAAIFRGFYARKDISDRVARQTKAKLESVDLENLLLDQVLHPMADPGDSAPGRLPEDLDLPVRLRFQTLNGDLNLIPEFELQALLLHESGHLPDILPWTEGRGSILQGIIGAISSLIRDGMLLGEWEYQAELRALASGQGMKWTLADIVETARSPEVPYFKPYRRLLHDLVFLARKRGLPELASWHLLSDQELHELALALCQKRHIEILPDAGVQALLKQINPVK